MYIAKLAVRFKSLTFLEFFFLIKNYFCFIENNIINKYISLSFFFYIYKFNLRLKSSSNIERKKLTFFKFSMNIEFDSMVVYNNKTISYYFIINFYHLLTNVSFLNLFNNFDLKKKERKKDIAAIIF